MRQSEKTVAFPGGGAKPHIVLSIAVLVSDRRDTIRQCLDSLAPIRAAVPSELILVDTGCSADMHELLKQYGDTVARFTWCNDFAKARNESLRHARGEWFLYLDDDEWFAETEELIGFFVSGEYRKYGRASYIQRNFLDMEATQYTDAWVNRMTKLEPDTHFESKIHEYLMPALGEAKAVNAVVHHFGYVYETKEALRKHYDRNRVLLQEMIEEEPAVLRWRMLLLQEYRAVSESRLLYGYGEECLAFTRDLDDQYDNITIGSFYGAQILALKEEKRYGEMLAACLAAIADRRMTRLCRTFASLRAADACFHLKQYGECRKWAEAYIQDKLFFDAHEQLLFLQKSVSFIGECLDAVMVKEGYSLLICAGLKLGTAEELEKHLDRLAWDEQHLYVYEEIMPTIVEAMGTMGREPVFERLIALMHGHTALWDYFCSQLTGYEQAGHSVSSVMDMIRAAAPDALASPKGDAGQESADGAAAEMQQLAAGIKQQLQLLMGNGMREQAAQILAQVRQLLPEDAELAQMEKELQADA